MGAFSGTLNVNEVFSQMRNMIISQRIYSGNIKGVAASLVDEARADGSLYGDTKLYISTDVLESHAWGGDSEASNLLSLDRPKDPKVQALVLNVFRQIRVTTDDILSKRMFMTEEVFVEFNGMMLAWLSDTKRVYDGTTYAAFFGTNVTSVGKQLVSVGISAAKANASTEEEGNRLEAEEIAKAMADLLVEMKDVSRDFNDNQQLRSYADEEIKVVWNSKYVHKIKYVDMPTMFHKEGLIQKFEERILPSRYFGTVITSSNISSYSASTPAAGKPIDSDDNTYVPGSNHANGCIRSLVEKSVTVSSTVYHVFPGDEIPAGATIVASTGDFLPGEVYIEQGDVICKIVTDLPPYLSAFSVGSEFWNPRSHTRNNYLTFARNSLEHLAGKPFITLKAV